MENQNTTPKETYQTISEEIISKHPILGTMGTLLLDEKTIERLTQYPPDEEVTEELVLKTAELFHRQYNELEIYARDNDWLYSNIEEEIGCAHTRIITELCYYLGWTEIYK